MPAYDRKALAPEILRRIAEGESLRAICRDEGMPHPSRFVRWCDEDAELAQQYARAMESRADTVFDEIFEIADDASNDWMRRNDPDNEAFALNGEHVQRSRLRIDARKWALARMSPKKFGDKVLNEHTGKDGEPIEVTFVRAKRDGG